MKKLKHRINADYFIFQRLKRAQYDDIEFLRFNLYRHDQLNKNLSLFFSNLKTLSGYSEAPFYLDLSPTTLKVYNVFNNSVLCQNVYSELERVCLLAFYAG